ncbi:hypothetical protein DOTSEDRAFT_75594 [Dothistroma septosporum NZE10]|uniref:Uncharacterized protein n=1 Tax=Dothistroma septosporum (strain NZE10 / CBS 128990) TaxID=675120 RepID=M2YJ55_DOTSN|nr:hypothetical protein DOTSEDRAFT_75594 [Dothistroma septosporum NZE10]
MPAILAFQCGVISSILENSAQRSVRERLIRRDDLAWVHDESPDDTRKCQRDLGVEV